MPTTNNKKVALITGITGQDGAYLAEFLLNKGYEVHGIKRRSSLFNTDRIDHLYQDPHETDRKFILHHGDLTDSSSLIRILGLVQENAAEGEHATLRDWGHARDYVEMAWLMLQQDQPEDFVIATGVQYSVRQFVEFAAAELGITICFEGEGAEEVGIVAKVEGDKAKAKLGDVIVKVDPRYFRPTEVETLLGDPSKAHEKLGWTPQTSLQELVKEMVLADYSSARRDALVKLAGFKTFDHHE